MVDPLHEVLPRLTLLGLLDADNYTPILLLLFILAKPQGGRDAFWFTVGVVATQLAGGAYIASVFERYRDLDSWIVDWITVFGQMGLGGFLVLLSIVWRAEKAGGPDLDALESIGHRPIVWFGVGIAIELTKLLTGVVYVEAVQTILAATPVLPFQAGLLLYFNLVAFSPFILIWLIYIFAGSAHPERLARVRHWLLRHEPTLIRLALFAVGVFLIHNGYRYGAS